MTKTIEIPEGYEEALERCKQWVAGTSGINPGASPKEVSEYIFPELAESENERIREVIESIVRVYGKTQGEWLAGYDMDTLVVHLRDAFACLERQKEQQPIMIQWTGKNLKEVIDFTGKSPRFDEWFKSWEDFESYVHSHGDILKLFCEDGSHYEVPVGAWIVKTPDGYNTPSRFRFIQQPAEWSEEDENTLNDAITAVDLMLTDSFKDSHPNLFKAFLIAKDFLKSLPKRFNLQPKVEWSEEDKMHLNNAILAAEKEWGAESRTAKFLKSLRPQPHWKPSEQQMNELHYASLPRYDYDCDVLQELYKDLQKLL